MGRASVPPHPDDAPVLDGAQQFRLQMQRDIADLVEEQRAPVGLLELAHMVRMGVGEGALDVAEELALEERLRDGAGVHRHHRLFTPEAVGVDFLRQHVLAGSVLAGDEHRGVRGRNLV